MTQVVAQPDAALDLIDVSTAVRTRRGTFPGISRVSFSLGHGRVLGIVGESGCGKSMTALAIMRSLPGAVSISEGTVRLDGVDLTALPESRMRKVRGGQIGMIFQDPLMSLDPCFSIGYQLVESLRAHREIGRKDARDQAAAMLERVGITNASSRLDQYPHEFSGGMRQRAMIAMALLPEPKLLIADEPTTALDVTIQAQILDLLAELQDSYRMSVLLITHNLGVINEIADDVVVMYAGEIVEAQPTERIFANPRHPYTLGLVESSPDASPRGTELPAIGGRVPELHRMPEGCRFAPRCQNRIERCTEEHPELIWTERGALRCFNPVRGDN